MGVLGDPAVREMLDGSDCVIVIGVVRTDLGTGFWTERLNPKSRILIDPDGARVLSPLRRTGNSPGRRSAGGSLVGQ